MICFIVFLSMMKICYVIFIFLLSGKVVLVASFETCAKMLGSRSTIFVLNIYAKMH